MITGTSKLECGVIISTYRASVGLERPHWNVRTGMMLLERGMTSRATVPFCHCPISTPLHCCTIAPLRMHTVPICTLIHYATLLHCCTVAHACPTYATQLHCFFSYLYCFFSCVYHELEPFMSRVPMQLCYMQAGGSLNLTAPDLYFPSCRSGYMHAYML